MHSYSALVYVLYSQVKLYLKRMNLLGEENAQKRHRIWATVPIITTCFQALQHRFILG